MNGTAEVRWRRPGGFYAGAGLRWAGRQDRLSLGDMNDERIPKGGTPGFAVIDLRGGYRAGKTFGLGVVAENITDAAYRYRGSSVNGPGFGLMIEMDVSL